VTCPRRILQASAESFNCLFVGTTPAYCDLNSFGADVTNGTCIVPTAQQFMGNVYGKSCSTNNDCLAFRVPSNFRCEITGARALCLLRLATAASSPPRRNMHAPSSPPSLPACSPASAVRAERRNAGHVRVLLAVDRRSVCV
jgi:hypothetical protein